MAIIAWHKCFIVGFVDARLFNDKLAENEVVVVVLGYYVSQTAKVIGRRDLGLKSYPKD